MMKRLLLMLLCLCMVVGLLPIITLAARASTNGYSQEAAVEWVRDKVGTDHDDDGAWGVQCVDLVKWYIRTLGHNLGSIEYAYNMYRYPVTHPNMNLTSWGWNRYTNTQTTPQPGDIVVFDASELSTTGHVGIVTDVNEQNYIYVDYNNCGGNTWGYTCPGGIKHDSWIVPCSGGKGAYRTNPLNEFSCVIRPDWPDSPPPQSSSEPEPPEESPPQTNPPVQPAISVSGSCGENVFWGLDSNTSTLIISGSGKMADYGEVNKKYGTLFNQTDRPWGVESNGVKHIVIEPGVTYIGIAAFYRCFDVVDISIPSTVTEIGPYSFDACISLTNLKIPYGVSSIGEEAFGSCESLVSVDIPNSVTYIGRAAFSMCKRLTKAIIPDGVTNIPDALFWDCGSLADVTLPQSITSIGEEAFYCCIKLPGMVIPDSVTQIGAGAFQNCYELNNIALPNHMTGSIAKSTFEFCHKLTSIRIPDGISSIGYHAFNGCEGLTNITIPRTVTSIAKSTFIYLPALTDIYYGGTASEWAAMSRGVNNHGLDIAGIHYNSTGPAMAVRPTNDKLSVDGKAATPAAYKINNANFFKLRDVAMLVNGTKAQFSVDYDAARRAIIITTGQAYTPQGYELQAMPAGSATAETSNDTVYINGEKVDLTAYKIGGSNFYGIRDLGQKLGFNVGWSEPRGMYIESDKPYSNAD